MGKKKIRKNRWSRRGFLKWHSNRANNVKSQHRQVQRELLKEKDEY